MFCYHCGKPFEDTSKFCNHCGSPVEQPTAGIVPEPVTTTQPETANPLYGVAPEAPMEVWRAAEVTPEAPQDFAAQQAAAQMPFVETVFQPGVPGQAWQPTYNNQMAPPSKPKRKLKENKPLFFSLIAVLTIIVLVGGLFTGIFVSRVIRYNKAQEYFDQEDFVAARDLYLELEDFRDSAYKLYVTNQNIDYLTACEIMELAVQAQDRDQIQQARTIFRALGGFKNSTSQTALCDRYLKFFDAEDLLAAGSNYDAYQLFNDSGVYDYEDRALECTLPYPDNGIMYRNPDYTSRAISVTFINDTEYPSYFKVYAENGDLVLSVFLDGNSRTTIYVGSGRYKFNQASVEVGGYWFGETDVFGDEGYYETCIFDGNNDAYLTFNSNYYYTLSFYKAESDDEPSMNVPLRRDSF